MKSLRAVAAWLVFIAAESVHGVLRALVLRPWLEPRIGSAGVEAIGFAVGTLLLLLVAWLLVPWIGVRRTGPLLAVGALWTVLTFGFEAALGRWARGYAWDQILAAYDPRAGGWMGFALLAVLLAPWLVARLRRLPQA